MISEVGLTGRGPLAFGAGVEASPLLITTAAPGLVPTTRLGRP